MPGQFLDHEVLPEPFPACETLPEQALEREGRLWAAQWRWIRDREVPPGRTLDCEEPFWLVGRFRDCEVLPERSLDRTELLGQILACGALLGQILGREVLGRTLDREVQSARLLDQEARLGQILDLDVLGGPTGHGGRRVTHEMNKPGRSDLQAPDFRSRGRAEMASRRLRHDAKPSWLNLVEHGAPRSRKRWRRPGAAP